MGDLSSGDPSGLWGCGSRFTDHAAAAEQPTGSVPPPPLCWEWKGGSTAPIAIGSRKEVEEAEAVEEGEEEVGSLPGGGEKEEKEEEEERGRGGLLPLRSLLPCG